MSRITRTVLLGALLSSTGATSASALVWSVPGDNSGTCTVGVPSCDTIAAAVAAATDGDTISIGSGTFAGAGNFDIILDKELVIEGSGRNDTTIEPNAGAFGFSIRADDVTIRDLAIDGGARGIRFQTTAADSAQIRRVDFRNSTIQGIEIATNQPVTDAVIDDCTFTSVATGIRMASTSQVDGLSISDSTFTGNSYAIYQANDGGTSTLRNLQISDSTFTNQTLYAIYAEEMRDSTIADSVFTNNRVAFQLLKLYDGSGVGAANIAIERNQFSAHTFTTINFEVYTLGLEGGATISDNQIDVDVSTLAFNAAGIFVGLNHTLTHAPVQITGNTIRLAGSFGGATAAFGVRLRRNGPVVLSGNILDGGNVGGSSESPATSGLYIESRNSSVAAMPGTTTIDASCNRITGFRNGVSVFDSFNSAYGGLDSGATVTLDDNAIAGNSDFGVRNGGDPSATVAAADNFWGCSAGPGNPGCDVVDGNVDATAPATEAPTCAGCSSDADCVDACLALAQCEDGVCIGTSIPGCGDHYISYQAKAPTKDLAKLPIPGNVLPKNFALTIDDVHLDDGDADDPENFVVMKPRNLLIAARPDSAPSPNWPDLAYLRYTSRPGKQSTAPAGPDGKFPKPVKHVPRTFQLENEFGTIEVVSRKVVALLVPAATSADAPAPVAPGETTHFHCYGVKPTKAITDQTPDNYGKGQGKLRKDMQAFFAEEFFDECATNAAGAVGFEGTPVEGMCLFDIRVPVELCNPANTSNVEPDRTTSAVIADSLALTEQSLLCYRIKPSTKVNNGTVGAILGLSVRAKLPKAMKVPKRGIKTGDALYVAPGSDFPGPTRLDTSRQQTVCVPTRVTLAP